MAWAGPLACATTLPRWAWSQPQLAHANDPFALGVASGEPTADGVVLWTRLLPAPGTQALTVQWEVAHDPAFTRIAQRGQSTALPQAAYSVHTEVRGLAPGRWYYYRFMQGNAVSPIGRTRTAPAMGDMPNHLRLAFASCQNWEQGYYAAWQHLVADQPDLVLFLGDYIYEYAMPRDASDLARSHSLPHAHSLQDFRARYALYKSDAALQAAHAACPWAVIWDDHEVQNDYAGTQGRGDATAFAALRSAAWQAFYEHMPLRANSLPGAQGMGLHRHLQWGQLARLHLLDTRQHRHLQACRPQSSRSAPAVQPAQCASLADPARTLLGTAQEQWLDAALGQDAKAGTRWSLLAQTTLFAPRRYPSGVVATDTWDGYPAARQRLLDSLARHAPRNAVFLGGDIHQNYVCQVPAHAHNPDAPVLASEFCGTSISSRAGTTQQQVDAVRRHNPHVLLARCEQRGYGLADITPQHWTTTLRVLGNALDPHSPVHTQARFVVMDGKPGPQTA